MLPTCSVCWALGVNHVCAGLAPGVGAGNAGPRLLTQHRGLLALSVLDRSWCHTCGDRIGSNMAVAQANTSPLA